MTAAAGTADRRPSGVCASTPGSPDERGRRGCPGTTCWSCTAPPVTRRGARPSPGLRLVCCARGGPVNVDVERRARARDPGGHHAGQERPGGRRADARVPDHARPRRLPVPQRFLLDGGALGESTFEGAEFFGVELRRAARSGSSATARSAGASARAAAALGMRVHRLRPRRRGAAARRRRRAAATLRRAARRGRLRLAARARDAREREHDVDAGEFAAMQPGAFFVNTARETLVDEDALVRGARARATSAVPRSTSCGRRPTVTQPAARPAPTS